MGERTEPAPRLFGEHSNYVFGHVLDERQRLEFQFSLLREDFNLWFDEMLRLGGLSTDPDHADWSVLDMGCGEGQFSREIARRYPHARVVGADADVPAIAAASANGGPGANVRFLVHDAREQIPEDVVPEGGFDAVIMWLVLLYLPDRRAALANLVAVLAPHGVMMLGNIPDQTLRLDHPSAVAILTAGQQAMRRLGTLGLEHELDDLLRQEGLADVTTVVLCHPVGGATRHGQRWYAYALANLRTGKLLLVDLCKMMDGAEYDRHVEQLANASVLELSGDCRFLVTLARRC
jgi:2-polyprenyl-3-methyl-5-hydroxy-6-metoxy-1,4-benzoquinol methylase